MVAHCNGDGMSRRKNGTTITSSRRHRRLTDRTMQKAVKWLMIGLTLGLNDSGWAEDLDAGKTEYLRGCAGCHGDDGKGKGPLSEKLKTAPANLTALGKKNNGVFPLSAVYQSIDGRNVTESHGIREMPIWGCRHEPSPVSPNRTYKPDPYRSHLDLSCDLEDIIANRILSVVEYLRRIQEK